MSFLIKLMTGDDRVNRKGMLYIQFSKPNTNIFKELVA
jgi:hypothetical protein